MIKQAFRGSRLISLTVQQFGKWQWDFSWELHLLPPEGNFYAFGILLTIIQGCADSTYHIETLIIIFKKFVQNCLAVICSILSTMFILQNISVFKYKVFSIEWVAFDFMDHIPVLCHIVAVDIEFSRSIFFHN